jgi:hypothetical protein
MLPPVLLEAEARSFDTLALAEQRVVVSEKRDIVDVVWEHDPKIDGVAGH